MTESALRRLGAGFGPPGSGLRRFRIALVAALGLLCLWLVGPYDPWSLPGAPSLFPRRWQSLIHTVLVVTWWVALVNALVCAALLLTSKLWARALPSAPGASDGRARGGPGNRRLAKLCGRARSEGRPLYLVYGLDAERKRSRLFELVRDVHFFDPVARVDALETDMTYHVVRYTGLPLLGIPAGAAAR